MLGFGSEIRAKVILRDRSLASDFVKALILAGTWSFDGAIVAIEIAPMVTNGDHEWLQWRSVLVVGLYPTVY